jgi:predicted unusual protein kinase regulating ubiquinone biosynthesis (AarF/ABC1/UbiB family)
LSLRNDPDTAPLADPPDSLRAVRELLARLSAESGRPISTSALGRLRRTATVAVRTGAGLLVGRLGGQEGLNSQAIERLVLSMGELKGIAMKAGQILSYMDTTLPPQTRELLSICVRKHS